MSIQTITCTNPGCRRSFVVDVTYVYCQRGKHPDPNLKRERCPHCGFDVTIRVSLPERNNHAQPTRER